MIFNVNNTFPNYLRNKITQALRNRKRLHQYIPVVSEEKNIQFAIKYLE